MPAYLPKGLDWRLIDQRCEDVGPREIKVSRCCQQIFASRSALWVLGKNTMKQTTDPVMEGKPVSVANEPAMPLLQALCARLDLRDRYGGQDGPSNGTDMFNGAANECIESRRGFLKAFGALIASVTATGVRDSPAQTAPALPPTLTLSLNHLTLRPGDTLRVGLTVRNSGPALSADFYFGMILPDGVTVQFITGLSPPDTVGTRLDASPATFRPLLANIFISQNLDIAVADFFTFSFLQSLSRGDYIFFAALTPPGAFADGRIDPGDLVAFDSQLFSAAVGEKVVLIGSSTFHHFRVGPADRADLATLRTAVAATKKWEIFADEFEHISPSRNEQRITDYVKLHVWGNMNVLYKSVPRLERDGTAPPLYPPLTSDFAAIMSIIGSYGARGGPRGTNVMSPYTTWHGHTRRKDDGTISMSPHIPMWVGIQMDGTVSFAMRDGSVYDAFKIPGANATSDFTFYRAGPKLFFVCDSLNRRILKVDRHPAIDAAGHEDFSKWVVTTLATGFIKPTSVRAVGSDIYVADNGANAIYKLAQDGTKTKLLDVPSVFWIDHTSDGKLIVACNDARHGVYRIDPSAPALGPDLLPASYSVGSNWMTVSVDRNGTFGPKDEFTVISVGPIQSNVGLWRYQNGVMGSYPWAGQQGWANVGNTKWCADTAGHYLWVAEHHPDEAVMMVQGLSNPFPSLIASRPVNYAVEDFYDNSPSGPFVRGRTILDYGTVAGVEYGTRPSIHAQLGECWSVLGLSADVIAELSFAEQAAFVQQGMLGSFPRPEIKGRDLYAILYVLNRSSQRFLREGSALMDGLLTYCQPSFGTEMPAITQRYPADGDLWLDMVPANGTLTLSAFIHPYPLNVTTPESGLVVRVMIDEGLPEQIGLGLLSSPWRMPIPTNLTPGQHSVRCLPVSGVADIGKYRAVQPC